MPSKSPVREGDDVAVVIGTFLAGTSDCSVISGSRSSISTSMILGALLHTFFGSSVVFSQLILVVVFEVVLGWCPGNQLVLTSTGLIEIKSASDLLF